MTFSVMYREQLAEYDFVAAQGRIYRVFGKIRREHSVYVLIRYYQQDGRWAKSKRHGAENNDREVLSLYPCPPKPLWPHGICLYELSNDKIEAAFGPYDKWEEFMALGVHDVPVPSEIVERLQDVYVEQPNVRLGVTGSHLVGLVHEESDLDILVVGLAHAEQAEDLLGIKKLLMPVTVTAGFSSTAQRFVKLSGSSDKESRPDIFATSINGQKVNLCYARSRELVVSTDIRAYEWPMEVAGDFLVVSASQRLVFPVEMVVEVRGKEVKCLARDHAARYLLVGDSGRAQFEVDRSHGDQIIMTELLAVY